MFEKSNWNRKTRNWQATVLLGLLASGALFWWLWEVYHPLPESKSGWLIVSSFLLVLITNIVIWFLSWNYIARSTNPIKLAYGGFVGGTTGLIIGYPVLDNLLAMLIILNLGTIIGCGIGDSIDTEKRIIPSIVAGLIGMLWSFPLIILGAIVSNVVSSDNIIHIGITPLTSNYINSLIGFVGISVSTVAIHSLTSVFPRKQPHIFDPKDFISFGPISIMGTLAAVIICLFNRNGVNIFHILFSMILGNLLAITVLRLSNTNVIRSHKRSINLLNIVDRLLEHVIYFEEQGDDLIRMGLMVMLMMLISFMAYQLT